jgi:replication fork clamp-binding protein CrfC
VFPVSAQKALLAKVNGDDALLVRSRLPRLESALSGNLVPAKRDIVGAAAMADVRSLVGSVKQILDARAAGIAEQLAELQALRGKNQDVVEHMMQRVRDEKAVFERGLSRFSALRNVFTQQTTELYDLIGLEALRANAGRTRRSIEASLFTKGVRGAMNDFFSQIRADLDASARKAGEIHEMMSAMYARFAKEHNLETYSPPPFSMLKYLKEVERLERAYQQHINTLWNMASKAKFPLMRRFFETVASRVKHLYTIANRDIEAWLKSVMSPLETQVREHQMQLRRRLDSIKRIHRASDELEERIAELVAQGEALEAQARALDMRVGAVESIVRNEELPLAANAA